MKIKKKIIHTFAIIICCKISVLPINSAYANWPTINADAVSSFISTVSTGLAEIGVSQAQIENYTTTIYTIGDQVSTIAKYVTDIKKNIESIKASVEIITKALEREQHNMDELLNGVNADIEESEAAKTDITDKTVDTVNQQTTNSEEVDPEIIEEFVEEIKMQDSQMKQKFDEASKKLKEFGERGKNALEDLRKIVNNANIDETNKSMLLTDIDNMQKKLSDLQEKCNDMLNDMKKDYNENSQKIYEAYNDYQQAIADYNSGKITREELAAKGEYLKEIAKNAQDTTDYTYKIDEFSKQVEEMIQEIQDLSEKITNTIANNKDYPDEVMLNTDKLQKFAFNFHQENENINLTGCFANKGGKGSCANLFPFKNKKKNRIFLLSKELTADAKGARTAKRQEAQCQELTFQDIEDGKQNHFVDKLRDCLTRANTEKTYFNPNAATEEELVALDIFDGNIEPNFRPSKDVSFEKKGVYRHVVGDYDNMNISLSNENKQYVASWMGMTGKKKDDDNSKLNYLRRQMTNIKDERNASVMLGKIEIEYLMMFNRLRQVQSISNARRAVEAYRQLKNLYIDGRDNDFLSANNEDEPVGIVKEKNCKDCDEISISVISNVFPYLCDASGADFSLPYIAKNDAGKIKKAEEKITECMRFYVEQATNGSTKGKAQNSPDKIKREWHIKETKAMTDSLFHTFAIATINLYRSAKEYAVLDSPKKLNIASIKENLKDSKNTQNDYASCSQINHYGAHQLLTIIDADAQSLQSEILGDMLNVTLDYFDVKDPNAVGISEK